jgi:hypothetical protein
MTSNMNTERKLECIVLHPGRCFCRVESFDEAPALSAVCRAVGAAVVLSHRSWTVLWLLLFSWPCWLRPASADCFSC